MPHVTACRAAWYLMPSAAHLAPHTRAAHACSPLTTPHTPSCTPLSLPHLRPPHSHLAPSAAKSQTFNAAAVSAGATVAREYSHLPMTLVEVSTPEALEALRNDPAVASVEPNRVRKLMLDRTLDLIDQPEAFRRGGTGAGCAVAVLGEWAGAAAAAAPICSSCRLLLCCATAATAAADAAVFKLQHSSTGCWADPPLKQGRANPGGQPKPLSSPGPSPLQTLVWTGHALPLALARLLAAPARLHSPKTSLPGMMGSGE